MPSCINARWTLRLSLEKQPSFLRSGVPAPAAPDDGSGTAVFHGEAYVGALQSVDDEQTSPRGQRSRFSPKGPSTNRH